jgi:hypothetical protein
VNLIGIVGQQGKPDIIGFRDGTTETAAINIANLEVFKIAAFPAWLNGHNTPPL